MKRKATDISDSENEITTICPKKRKICAKKTLVLQEIVLNIPNIFKRQSPQLSHNRNEWELDFNNNYVERSVALDQPVIISMDASTQTRCSSDDSYRLEIEQLHRRLRALKESNRQLIQLIGGNWI